MAETPRQFQSPEEKYRNDKQYRLLVDTLEQMIHLAQFTPSELREAAIFAAIRYESRHIRPQFMFTPDKV